ncbi:translation initiation factor IF-2-like [Choloepus didactylus]|uniref:translation initiation factor IF-2-like n=1 Tax=Choloepus didactylus TaxID=27675 RepID=UPI00189E4DB0|nr:translation initiation factor IF-2-like [Choloepus didactylus]
MQSWLTPRPHFTGGETEARALLWSRDPSPGLSEARAGPASPSALCPMTRQMTQQPSVGASSGRGPGSQITWALQGGEAEAGALLRTSRRPLRALPLLGSAREARTAVNSSQTRRGEVTPRAARGRWKPWRVQFLCPCRSPGGSGRPGSERGSEPEAPGLGGGLGQAAAGPGGCCVTVGETNQCPTYLPRPPPLWGRESA